MHCVEFLHSMSDVLRIERGEPAIEFAFRI